MIIIVDSNILFSACISAETENRLPTVIFNPLAKWHLVSCYYAFVELFNHREKLIKASKLPAEKLGILLYEVIKQVTFYNESSVESEHWLEADRLTLGVDSKDISFVALALQTGGWLWTGDKKLASHLLTVGFDRVITTAELYERFQHSKF